VNRGGSQETPDMEMKGNGVEEGGQKTEDIQIAQRIIADVRALLTCVPYLLSASHFQQVFTQTNAAE
jgi:hypothetical protein